MPVYDTNGVTMKNGSLKLERGIPIPTTGPRGEVTSLMKAMKVGDSFIYPRAKRTALTTHAKNAGIKVVTRSVSETEVRVWRVK